jgi:hypothetical protein
MRYLYFFVFFILFSCSSEPQKGGSGALVVTPNKVNIAEKTEFLTILDDLTPKASATELAYKLSLGALLEQSNENKGAIEKLSLGHKELVQIVADIDAYKDGASRNEGISTTEIAKLKKWRDITIPAYEQALEKVTAAKK